jgi:ABC-type multidrug transport system ATPase subunit
VSHVRDDAKPTPELEAALGMDELKELALDRMSLGQRRRAVIAAALIGSPKVLIFDEPDNGLDAKHAAALIELLTRQVAENAIAIVATHDRELLNRIDARVVEL